MRQGEELFEEGLIVLNGEGDQVGTYRAGAARTGTRIHDAEPPQ